MNVISRRLPVAPSALRVGRRADVVAELVRLFLLLEVAPDLDDSAIGLPSSSFTMPPYVTSPDRSLTVMSGIGPDSEFFPHRNRCWM